MNQSTNNNGMRKIFIPFEKNEKIGGPMTFMRNLQNYLDEAGFRYTTCPLFARGIFFPIAYNLHIIKWIKFFGGKVVQRLDGIYYPSKHGKEYEKLNESIKNIYQNFSDYVVFQSEYSRRQCFSMFGEKRETECGIIVNGVNSKIFFPKDKKEKSEKIKFITTGNFRSIDMLEPIILALDSLSGKFEFELLIIGPVTNDRLKKYLERSYVNHVGPKKLQEVAEILREADIFIFSGMNPPCPNSVLEAVASGLPVVGFESGSMPELLHFNKELLAHVSDEIFQKYEDFDPEKLAEKIELAATQYGKYKSTAMKSIRLYSLENCGKKYVEVFNKLLK